MLKNICKRHTAVGLIFLLCPIWVALSIGVPVSAQDEMNNEPHPAPTAAVDLNKSKINYVSKACISDGLPREEAEKQALEIAELEGLYYIAKNALSSKDNGSSINWDLQAGGCQHLNWLARTKFNRQSAKEGSVSVKLVDESWLSYKSQAYKTQRLLYKKDIDKDGIEERIYLDANSGLEIKRGKRVIGALYPLSSFHASSIDQQTCSSLELPSPNLISYISINSVKDAVLQGDMLSLEVILDVRESTYGIASSRRLVNKTFQIQIAKDERSPFVNIIEPIGNRINSLKQAPFRGIIDAPAGILNAALTLNGEKLWSTPLGLKVSNLEIDLCLDLKAGANKIEIDIADLEGRKLHKAVELYAMAAGQGTKTRTLIVGPNYGLNTVNSQKAMQVRQAFVDRGFSVKTLPGAEAKAVNIKKYLDNMKEASTSSDLLVLYLIGDISFDKGEAAFTSADEGSEAFSITYSYLSQYYKSLFGSRFLLIWDAESANKEQIPNSSKNNAIFYRQLENSLCAALICYPSGGTGEAANGFTSLFLDNLNKNKDNDIFQAVELTYPILCAKEFKQAKEEKRALRLPLFLSF
ncbi:MAG: hypothetical protein ACI376_05410 [Candidatus Bruticola sp.]